MFGLLAFFLPRVAILGLAIFGTYLNSSFTHLSPPFNGVLLPILGFLFAPYTLLAYCLAIHQNGSADGMWLILIGVAVLLDLGVIGHGARSRKRR